MTLATAALEHTIDSSGDAKLHRQRLIEEGLSSIEASAAGRRERYARGITSHTTHVWWARRPHSVMRALVFASLADAGDEGARRLFDRLGSGPKAAAEVLEAARRRLRNRYGRAPRVLDMFGGGGTIAFEAVNLGAETWASDINPLSVFIQRCLLEYPSRVDGARLGALVTESGEGVLTRLAERTAPLFPLRNRDAASPPVAYLWTYMRRCGDCGYRFFLVRRPWLSRRAGRRLGLRAIDADCGQRLVICESAAEETVGDVGVWRGRSGPVVCPRCSHPQSRPDALACDDWLAAVVSPAPRAGKQFEPGDAAALPSGALLETFEETLLGARGAGLPESRLPHWSGVVNPPLYGIGRHADIFNSRQRVVMLALLDALCCEHERLVCDHGEATARAVTGMLSALVDQLVDWNCRLSMWIPQNEQIGRAFCGPGVAMLWDYAEMDPCMDGPANLRSKLERIVRACDELQGLPRAARVTRADATRLGHGDDFFDAVISDPPYYDNLPYAALADCFYAWKRPLLQRLEPELFAASSTVDAGELVAPPQACCADAAHQRYCRQLRAAIAEAARVLAVDGVLALVYSHGTVQAWQALIQAIRAACLEVTDVLPLAIERRQRPRAMSARAVNTCVVIVMRKSARPDTAANALERFRATAGGNFLTELLDAGWDPDQAALALYAKGAVLLASAPGNESSDQKLLNELEEIVRTHIPTFCMRTRRPAKRIRKPTP